MLSIIVVGRTGTGKTCLINRYVSNTYCAEHPPQPTMSMTFSLKELILNGNDIRMQIWDTSGSDIYQKQMNSKATISTFWKNVSGLLVVAE